MTNLINTALQNSAR